MANITIDEKRLEELVEKSIQKHLKLTFEDMEEVRRSPAAAIVRLETRVEAIEKTMATKADIAELRAEFSERFRQFDLKQNERIGKVETTLNERIGKVESTLNERIGKVETTLGERIGKVETTLGERIGKVETTLGERIGEVETTLGERIGKVETTLSERIARLETSNKLILAILLPMIGAMIAALIKLFFFL